jgi:hypothetical protein
VKDILVYNAIPGVGKSIGVRADDKSEFVFTLHKTLLRERYAFHKGDGMFRSSLSRDDVLEIVNAMKEFIGDGE